MKYYVLAYTLMMCILLYTADIPTHCYQSHVEGEWIFEATTPRSLDKKELYEHTCGHKNPSHENSSHLATIKKELLTQNFKITFNKDNTVQLNYGGKERKGTWTMIYNEGFDVRIKEENISFFAFLKYAPFNNKAGWQSFCYQILPGWFHIGGEWGCFTGNKNVDKWNAATNNGIEDAVKIVFPIKERFLEKLHEIQESAQEMRFSESQTAVTFTLDTTFSEMVEKLNSMNLSWKACNYPQFDGMTLRDLNKFVGRKKKMNQRHTERDIFATQTNLFKSSSYEKKSTDTTIIKHATISAKERATGSIPASFSWRNHPVWKNKILPKPRQQVSI